MSDIEKFIAARKARNPKAWSKFDQKYRRYAIGMLLAAHREGSGLTMSEFARRTRIQMTALSRLENHGKDVRLSTISRYVQATGRPLSLRITPDASNSRRKTAQVELVPA